MRLTNFLLLILFWANSLLAQNFIPDISARVDTTNTEVNKVYNLYENYLNSKPDSIYQNPNWNSKEIESYKKTNLGIPDRSFQRMLNGLTSDQFLAYYKPKILQIDKVEENRYLIKTIFMTYCEDKEYKAFTPLSITRLYAVKDNNGNYMLENAITYDTQNWKRYSYKYITYVVHPSCIFNKKEAKKAIEFCDAISKQFGLEKPEPIIYYLTGNSDDLGRLVNFDYWLSYSTGFAYPDLRELYTSLANEFYAHELLHLLFPAPKDITIRPAIINEGLATWLGGPSHNESFESALGTFSKDIKYNGTINLESVMTFSYHNKFDNNVFYLTGGVICKLVYEKHGVKGINELLNSPADNDGFRKVLEKLFDMPYVEVDEMIINYIKNYSA